MPRAPLAIATISPPLPHSEPQGTSSAGRCAMPGVCEYLLHLPELLHYGSPSLCVGSHLNSARLHHSFPSSCHIPLQQNPVSRNHSDSHSGAHALLDALAKKTASGGSLMSWCILSHLARTTSHVCSLTRIRYRYRSGRTPAPLCGYPLSLLPSLSPRLYREHQI